jgi:hypothetical protein
MHWIRVARWCCSGCDLETAFPDDKHLLECAGAAGRKMAQEAVARLVGNLEAK